MAKAHVVIGPVGAGKSTWCARFALRERALHLNLDAWMARLYGADPRPAEGRIAWYLERRDRCLAQMTALADELLELGQDVILEVGLLGRAERTAFYAHLDEVGAEICVHVIDAPIEVRRERVMRRNVERGSTFSVEVPLPFFEAASAAWEPPDSEERAQRDVVDV